MIFNYGKHYSLSSVTGLHLLLKKMLPSVWFLTTFYAAFAELNYVKHYKTRNLYSEPPNRHIKICIRTSLYTHFCLTVFDWHLHFHKYRLHRLVYKFNYYHYCHISGCWQAFMLVIISHSYYNTYDMCITMQIIHLLLKIPLLYLCGLLRMLYIFYISLFILCILSSC